jgi:hypothetical protein
VNHRLRPEILEGEKRLVLSSAALCALCVEVTSMAPDQKPRRLTLILLSLLAMVSALAAGDPGKPQVDLVLAVGQTDRCLSDKDVFVTLDAVLADNRCPENVLCVRAGGVRVKLLARRGKETPLPFILDSDRGDGTGEACGMRFRILLVEPGRRSGEAPPPEKYRITLEARPISR